MSTKASIFPVDPAAAFKPAVVLGQGLPPDVNGQPAAYFWKEMLVPGEFQDKSGAKFKVDAKRVDTLIACFNRAKAKGYKPFLPAGGHRERQKNYGWLVDVRKNARGALEGLHQVIGADAVREFARNGSSICTIRDVTDETGEHYEELIDHNAILPDPQLSGLGDFIPFNPALAASRFGGDEVEVLELSANCGTGYGGFKEGNTCAAGSSGTSLPDHVNRSDLEQLDRRIAALRAKMEQTRKVWDKPNETPGPMATGRDNYSMGKRLDAENNRKADAFREHQQAQSEHDRLVAIREGYIAGRVHPNGQPRRPGAVEAREAATERNDQKIAAQGYNVRKINSDLVGDGHSTLPDGTVVTYEMNFDDPNGGYRLKVTTPDGATVHGKYHASISKMQASGELKTLLRKKTSLSRSTPMTEQQLDAIRELIGAETLTDESAIPLLIEWGTKTAKAKATAETAAETARTELSRRPAPKAVDPDILAEAAALKLEKIEHLAATGAISAQGADFLRKRVNGDDGKPLALMLSRTGAGEAPIDALLAFAALGKAGVVPDGKPLSGVQELSRQRHDNSAVTGGNGQPKQQTPEEIEAAVKANLEQTELGRRALAASRK